MVGGTSLFFMYVFPSVGSSSSLSSSCLLFLVPLEFSVSFLSTSLGCCFFASSSVRRSFFSCFFFRVLARPFFCRLFRRVFFFIPSFCLIASSVASSVAPSVASLLCSVLLRAALSVHDVVASMVVSSCLPRLFFCSFCGSLSRAF